MRGGLIAIQLVEEIAIAHEVEDRATKAFLSLLYLAPVAQSSILSRQALRPVAALHPCKCRGFQ